jgi:hypothetical protein
MAKAKQPIRNESTDAADEFTARCRDIKLFVGRGAVFAENCNVRDHQYALLSLLDVIYGAEKRADELALLARNEVLKHSNYLIDEAVDRLVGDVPPEVSGEAIPGANLLITE